MFTVTIRPGRDAFMFRDGPPAIGLLPPSDMSESNVARILASHPPVPADFVRDAVKALGPASWIVYDAEERTWVVGADHAKPDARLTISGYVLDDLRDDMFGRAFMVGVIDRVRAFAIDDMVGARRG